MNNSADVDAILEFLPCPTPATWVEAALDNIELLLVDHANCEKKAASTALHLLYRYVEHPLLLHKLSRLAREELRHFEQVLALMQQRGIDYPQLTASRYARGLQQEVRRTEPERLIDTLIMGAIIEARSCERFAALVSVLLPQRDVELGEFYASLLQSEARHYRDYLALAKSLSSPESVAERLAVFFTREQELVEGVDAQFRFHSGVPV